MHSTGEPVFEDEDAVEKRRCLIVDDLLATGGTAAATARLVERQGGTVGGDVAVGGEGRRLHPLARRNDRGRAGGKHDREGSGGYHAPA